MGAPIQISLRDIRLKTFAEFKSLSDKGYSREDRRYDQFIEIIGMTENKLGGKNISKELSGPAATHPFDLIVTVDTPRKILNDDDAILKNFAKLEKQLPAAIKKAVKEQPVIQVEVTLEDLMRKANAMGRHGHIANGGVLRTFGPVYELIEMHGYNTQSKIKINVRSWNPEEPEALEWFSIAKQATHLQEEARKSFKPYIESQLKRTFTIAAAAASCLLKDVSEEPNAAELSELMDIVCDLERFDAMKYIAEDHFEFAKAVETAGYHRSAKKVAMALNNVIPQLKNPPVP